MPSHWCSSRKSVSQTLLLIHRHTHTTIGDWPLMIANGSKGLNRSRTLPHSQFTSTRSPICPFVLHQQTFHPLPVAFAFAIHCFKLRYDTVFVSGCFDSISLACHSQNIWRGLINQMSPLLIQIVSLHLLGNSFAFHLLNVARYFSSFGTWNQEPFLPFEEQF